MFMQSPGQFIDDLSGGLCLLVVIVLVLYAIGSAVAGNDRKDK